MLLEEMLAVSAGWQKPLLLDAAGSTSPLAQLLPCSAAAEANVNVIVLEVSMAPASCIKDMR